MKRLQCGERLLRIKRDQPDFTEWSQERDPDSIAWQYQQGQFVPLEVSHLDSGSGKLEHRPYSGREMMKRFPCGDRLLRIKRDQPDFTEWSQERDPDGIAWQYRKGQFIPLEVSKVEEEVVKVEPKPSAAKTKTKTKPKQKTVQKTQKKASAITLENRPYTVREIMKRFHCGDRLLRIKRSQPDFVEWSQQRDPDGIAWKYRKGQFVPQMG